MINRRPEFISGKRISLDGIGFQNPKITTAKSLEKVGETAVYSKRGDDIIKLTTVSMKDDTRDKDQPNVEEAGQAGSSTITTTYSVDPTTGAITERVGEPVVVTPTATIVKVAAKDKVVKTPIEPEVEYVRDGEREVVTPNETR